MWWQFAFEPVIDNNVNELNFFGRVNVTVNQKYIYGFDFDQFGNTSFSSSKNEPIKIDSEEGALHIAGHIFLNCYPSAIKEDFMAGVNTSTTD